MSQIIATKFTTRAKLLKGDLPNLGADMTTSMGLNVLDPGALTPPHGPSLRTVSRPRRPPPELPVPPHFGSKDGFPVNHGAGDLGMIGEVVTKLRHEFIPPSIKSTMKRGNN